MRERFGKNVFFNSNVHINQTNICVLACKFCAFRRSKKQSDAYEFSIDSYLAEIEKYSDVIDEVHSVGGLHPDWDIQYYETLFRAVKHKYPDISIKALTAVEIKHLAKNSNLSFQDILIKLKDAGLTSIPGGGAEILNDEIRDIICCGKGMGGGVPLSGVIGRRDLLDLPEIGNMSSTHSANPMACATGMAVLEEIESKNLIKEDLLKMNEKKQFILSTMNFRKILPYQTEIFKYKAKYIRKILNLLIIS